MRRELKPHGLIEVLEHNQEQGYVVLQQEFEKTIYNSYQSELKGMSRSIDRFYENSTFKVEIVRHSILLDNIDVDEDEIQAIVDDMNANKEFIQRQYAYGGYIEFLGQSKMKESYDNAKDKNLFIAKQIAKQIVPSDKPKTFVTNKDNETLYQRGAIKEADYPEYEIEMPGIKPTITQFKLGLKIKTEKMKESGKW